MLISSLTYNFSKNKHRNLKALQKHDTYTVKETQEVTEDLSCHFPTHCLMVTKAPAHMLAPGSLGKHDLWQVITRLMKAEDENTLAACHLHAALSLSVSIGDDLTHHIVLLSPAEPV